MSKVSNVSEVLNVAEVSEKGGILDNKGYKKLIVWREAHKLALKIYKVTKHFPKEEIFGLVSQLRRAAISIPTNIVEGQAGDSKKDFCRFLFIANKSCAEVEYLLEASKDLGFIKEIEYDSIEDLRRKVGFLLYKFIRSIKK